MSRFWLRCWAWFVLAVFTAVFVLLALAVADAVAGTRGACYRFVRSAEQRQLLEHENRPGDPLAKNPRSSAFGCLQLIRSDRRIYATKLGLNPDTTSAAEQMRMATVRIDHRYGTDAKALAFFRAHGWH